MLLACDFLKLSAVLDVEVDLDGGGDQGSDDEGRLELVALCVDES